MNYSNAVILHGKPKPGRYEQDPDFRPSQQHWFQWLRMRLELTGTPTATPDMPNASAPNHDEWVKAFEKHDVAPGALLIGHSYGAGFLVRYLSERPELEVGKLVVVAPWMDPKKRYGDLLDFRLDEGLAERCAGGLAIYHSSLDDPEACASAERLIGVFPDAAVMDIRRYGHFMLGNSMPSEAFPEILDEVL